MNMPAATFNEHPLDVLTCLAGWQADGHATALCAIQTTEGGAVRDVGALMAVRGDGLACGYVSGGCIDADLILRAQRSSRTNQAETVRYGAGSAFVDLPLPCGGAIVIAILPRPNTDVVSRIISSLAGRRPVQVSFSSDSVDILSEHSPRKPDTWHVTYTPKLRLRLAGRGADCLALARIALASGVTLALQCVDADDIRAGQALGLAPQRLDTPDRLADTSDDAWTAFVLMFHDSDWEGPLLRQALQGPAFYIGAVGSRHTHARRLDALSAEGLSEHALKRIHGPVGLVASLRNASQLAISTLAQIIDHFEHRATRDMQRTAVILLAAGQSRRFAEGDKLMARLHGTPVLTHAAACVAGLPFARRLAVTVSPDGARAELLRAEGWQIITNPEAQTGQSSSLKRALEAIQGDASIDQLLLLLGDMPFIPKTHIDALLRTENNRQAARMTESEGLYLPPALVPRALFPALQSIQGDQGARQALLQTGPVTGVRLPRDYARDIDTVEDLQSGEAIPYG